MAETKFVSPARLGDFLRGLAGRFQSRELKTGSTTEYKVLSDNNLTDEMVERINSATTPTSAYRAKGSTAFADLPAPADAEVGDVWNVIDAFTTTDAFVEGAGAQYPAGTNVVRVEDGGAAKWDALAGVTDLSAYWAKADLVECTKDDVDALFSAGA